MRKLLLVLALVLLVLVLVVLVRDRWFAPAQEPLVFAVAPDEEVSVLEERYAPMVEYLSDALGREIEFNVATDYNAVGEAMIYGHADFAYFSANGYTLMEDEDPTLVEPIVNAVRMDTGTASYQSIIVARANSGMTVDDLDGCDFGFVDVGSTSGHLLPSAYFAQEGIEPAEFGFLGSHAAVIEAVANGAVDAGACANNRYYTAIDEGSIEEGEFVILWESVHVPTSPIVVREDMDPTLKANLIDAFLEMPREIIEHSGIRNIAFVTVTDADYDATRAIRAIKESLDK